MNLYPVLLSAHVVTAILGLGQIAGTAIVASSTPSETPVAPEALTVLRRLGLGTSSALALMLLTGVLLEYTAGGAFHATLWFRVSFLLAIALGALQGGIRRLLRKGDGPALRRVRRLSALMCVIVAVVAVLMELKPALSEQREQQGGEVVAPEPFAARCATCHGPNGHGDGAAAGGLSPHPPDFRDPQWQKQTSDDELRDVILNGGVARGRSALMPANAGLSPSELEALVRFIRAQARTPE